MATKSRNARGQRHHARCQPGNPFVNADQHVVLPSPANVRELEALTPAFIRWFRAGPGNPDATFVVEHLAFFFRFYPRDEETSSITALHPENVAAKMASLLLHTVQEGIVAMYCLMHFVEFLRDSSRWTGDQESFRAVHGLLTDFICIDLRAARQSLDRAVRRG
ncbi:hypothetical protein ASF72_00040 [Arthrobacter sp. Leaf141]|uniref:hypothetical protein n=1 Tax=Arthrobacter sp. Leaf141 TaxID=1736273 RepID=UPI0007015402|nr:hypothetical protein [Arthrobacter sp. Leaf141]KQR04842.1 hypothetical protein ASF72_00040 [Arthrobacter sp. Leaf141]